MNERKRAEMRLGLLCQVRLTIDAEDEAWHDLLCKGRHRFVLALTVVVARNLFGRARKIRVCVCFFFKFAIVARRWWSSVVTQHVTYYLFLVATLLVLLGMRVDELDSRRALNLDRGSGVGVRGGRSTGEFPSSEGSPFVQAEPPPPPHTHIPINATCPKIEGVRACCSVSCGCGGCWRVGPAGADSEGKPERTGGSERGGLVCLRHVLTQYAILTLFPILPASFSHSGVSLAQ